MISIYINRVELKNTIQNTNNLCLKLKKEMIFMFSIIVAIGKKNEIGKNNGLLWYIPEDLKNFKKITKGKMVVMD